MDTDECSSATYSITEGEENKWNKIDTRISILPSIFLALLLHHPSLPFSLSTPSTNSPTLLPSPPPPFPSFLFPLSLTTPLVQTTPYLHMTVMGLFPVFIWFLVIMSSISMRVPVLVTPSGAHSVRWN